VGSVESVGLLKVVISLFVCSSISFRFDSVSFLVTFQLGFFSLFGSIHDEKVPVKTVEDHDVDRSVQENRKSGSEPNSRDSKAVLEGSEEGDGNTNDPVVDEGDNGTDLLLTRGTDGGHGDTLGSVEHHKDHENPPSAGNSVGNASLVGENGDDLVHEGHKKGDLGEADE